jgi:hypothetical protein
MTFGRTAPGGRYSSIVRVAVGQSPPVAFGRPRQVAYLLLGITRSTALRPDRRAADHGVAHLTMSLQSLISLTVIGLVIAPPVNEFT